jgi:hypothetical protein
VSLAKRGLYGLVAFLMPLEAELFALCSYNLWLIWYNCHLSLVYKLEGNVSSALVADEKLIIVD